MKSPREEVESKKKDLTGTAFKRQGGEKVGKQRQRENSREVGQPGTS